MATKFTTFEEYIQRRVREMITANWSDFQIVQQLEAVTGRKRVVEEIAKQKLAASVPAK